MGKCVGRSCRKEQWPTAAAAAEVEVAAYLTLRSGRRVPAAASSRRRHSRDGGSCCGKGAAGSAAQKRRRRRVLVASQGEDEEESEETELPSSQESRPVVYDEGCGGAVRWEATRRGHESDAVAARAPLSPPKAEMEAFFAAAELAERRRFAETYNYDVALDRPLEGRFEWSPATST